MEQSSYLEEIRFWEHPSQSRIIYTEEKNKKICSGKPDASSPLFEDPSPDDNEARNNFWSISGDYIYRHHVDPRVKLYVSRKEPFPIPPRYIWRDQSKKYDISCGSWASHRRLLEYRKKPRLIRCVDRIHTIHNIWRKTSKWVWGAVDEETNDIETWLLVTRDMERHVRNSATKRKNKSGLSRNRSLTTLEDYVVFTSLIKETTKNARTKREIPMSTAMPCKIRWRTWKETCRIPDAPKTKYACTVEAGGSTRKRLERTLHRDHEHHIAGKGINSLNHYTLVHKFFPMPKAVKIPDAKAALDKECEKLETIPDSWRKSKSKKKLMRQGKRAKPCTLRHQWTSFISRIRSF